MFCRLEAYERNFNFGKCDNPVPPEYVMKLPDAMVYKDLNSDRKFAKVEIDDLILYLGLFEKKLDQTPINLYKEKYLCYMILFKSDEENCYYLKSGCRAEMKKSVVYTVDVCISFDGQILEARCECGAGMGPNAHCKHVAAVIYGAHVFSSKGSVLVENTCTEKLQSFHKVKKYTDSPAKAKDINIPGADESTNISYEPRKSKFINSSSYEAFFRNSCINFAAISFSCMPINQLFKPCNIILSVSA